MGCEYFPKRLYIKHENEGHVIKTATLLCYTDIWEALYSIIVFKGEKTNTWQFTVFHHIDAKLKQKSSFVLKHYSLLIWTLPIVSYITQGADIMVYVYINHIENRWMTNVI